jgi:DNA-binding NtrC family response regulator
MERSVNGCSRGLLGQSPQICEIRRLIEKLGRSRAPVLLLGESGTGKEVVARAIHDANPTGEFVPIDCGALVGPLVESDLFGHTKGAFTGASEAKRGLIEVAEGGTAFFDEIGDLPLEMQVKLLRLLQEREFRPVGSLKQHKVNIRVIAATHHDLARDAAHGTFRQDLYYRLNIVSLRLPALRDRKEDIPGLIAHFFQRHSAYHRLAPDALEAMMNYDWPGNVRELQNSIESMVALNTGPWLRAVDLPSPLQNQQSSDPPLASAAVAGSETGGFLPLRRSPPPAGLFLATVEKETILKALEATHGDRAKAANLLGIGRTTLYRKLKDYKIEN